MNTHDPKASQVTYIAIPAGRPPFLLPHGESPEDSSELGPLLPTDLQIREWIVKVREHLKAKDVYMTTEALRYWARYTFPAPSPEYRIVGERIAALMED